jgi:hypothetical protein
LGYDINGFETEAYATDAGSISSVWRVTAHTGGNPYLLVTVTVDGLATPQVFFIWTKNFYGEPITSPH